MLSFQRKSNGIARIAGKARRSGVEVDAVAIDQPFGGDHTGNPRALFDMIDWPTAKSNIQWPLKLPQI